MKKILFLLVPVFLIAITGLFISCDYLIPAPLGRNNPFDDEAQIGRFAVAASGPDSVVTVWDWRNPPSGIDKSRIIDKIRIVYSESDPPLSKYPINPDNVIEFTSNSDFSYEWENLNEDRDHYFALYAHEKGGMWLAPKRADIWFDSNGDEERWDIMMTGVTQLYVSTSADTNQVLVNPTNVNVAAPLLSIGFFRFDELFEYNYGAVLEAQIQTWVIGTAGDFLVVPMRRRVEGGMTWGEISDANFYDLGNAKAATVTVPNDAVDIKDQINIARLHGSNTIAFLSYSSFDVDIENCEFNNGTDFTFSVWRNN